MKNKNIVLSMDSLKTVKEYLKYTKCVFKDAGFINFERDTEILFGYLLKMKRSDIYLNHHRILDREEINKLKKMVEKRLDQIPIQYITQQQEFMGIDFYTEKGALIPRPETEILVEKVINIIKNKASSKCLKLADLGTGTGIIAISIANFLKNVKIYATDISDKALKIAQKNAIRHQCDEKIVFLSGDLFKVFKQKIKLNSLDGIISNPPYIPKDEIALLPHEIKENEPLVALDGGLDGLDYFRKIIEKSNDYLKKDGFLAMEIGIGQAKKIKDIIMQKEIYKKNIEIIKDYSGIERVIVAYKK